MKNTRLIQNKDHDLEDESRDPLGGRETVGCLFIGMALIGGFVFLLAYIINLIR